MYTYLMFDGNYYKIGKSIDPKKRLIELKTGNPKLGLVCFGNGTTESELHKLFRSKRIEGEFFRLDKCEWKLAKDLIMTGVPDKDRFYLIDLLKQKAKLHKMVCDYAFTFGKYKNRKLLSMRSQDEIRYCHWVVQNIKNNASTIVKHYVTHLWLFIKVPQKTTVKRKELSPDQNKKKREKYENDYLRPCVFSISHD